MACSGLTPGPAGPSLFLRSSHLCLHLVNFIPSPCIMRCDSPPFQMRQAREFLPQFLLPLLCDPFDIEATQHHQAIQRRCLETYRIGPGDVCEASFVLRSDCICGALRPHIQYILERPTYSNPLEFVRPPVPERIAIQPARSHVDWKGAVVQSTFDRTKSETLSPKVRW